MTSPDTPEPSLGERLSNLSPKQRALVERKLLERSKASSGADSEIVAQTGPGPWPLSPAQELMWLVQQLAENTALYNSSGARRLIGPLNIDALQRALDGVVARHEALRTTFEVHDGTPLQVVHPPSSMSMPLRDVSGLSEDARDAALEELLRSEVRTRFDLEKPLLIRAALLRLGDNDHVLVTVANHIVWDGWSKGVFFRELAEFYDAFSTGREPDLAPLPLQYRDYAVWQQSERVSERGRAQLTYWKNALTGAPALLDLPTDHPRPAEQTFGGDRQSLWLEAEVLDALKALSRAEGATLFMTLLSAWYVLLHRFSGQDDIVVGTPIAGRSRTQIEGLIGYFTNTLALRTSCAGDPTFAQLLQRVRDTALDAFANQDVSLEYVVREVAPARSLSHSSLFQSLFVVQNATSERLELPGIRMEALHTEPGTAKFDLSLGIGEHNGRLHASFEYATDLFDADTVARLARHFDAIVRAIVADREQPISKIALVDEHDRAQLLSELSGPVVERDERAGLHTLVSERAAATPDAIALVFEGASMCYRELDERTNRLAHHLRGLGVGPEVLVGVALDHRPELVVALLGVLKAGGACVPLDTDYPLERLALMLDDATPPVLLTTRALVERLPTFAGSTVLLDDDWPTIAQCPATAPTPCADGSTLAYVLYTSGSTGKPKGVLLEHRGLVNHALDAIDLYRLTPADRVLQFCSISFDISVEEIFSTLAAGATLVFRDDSMAVGGRGFLEWLDRNRVSVVDLPTAFWHEWVRDLDGLGAVPPASLRHVIVGGEKAQVGTLETWRRLVGERIAWVNTYGPTEASVVATAWEPPPASRPITGERLPIGRPLPNVTVRLLDAAGEPVPTGFRGEIHLGGPGVARGYLGQPEQTAASFVEDPLHPGHRLYRTGDVARLRADGTLEFLGRTDHQVKIRGFRVELSEVEAAALDHPDVAEAAIVVRDGPSGAQILVAYAVPRRGAEPTPDEVRAFLAKHLPVFMVPGAVVILEELPLTQNGKVDTAALPEPALSRSVASAAPQDDVERRLHGLVCSTLGVESVGVHDDLFDAGFHSLLAVSFFAGIERAFDVTLPLSALIQHPTIAGLAEIIRDRTGEIELETLVPLRRGGTRPPLFCVHGATGDVILYMNLVRNLGDDQPAYGIQCVGLDGKRPQYVRFEDMAADYVREIVQVQPEGPYFLTGYCLGGVIAFEIARQLRETGREVAMIGLIDSMPFGRFENAKTVRNRLKHNARRFGQLPTSEIIPFLKRKISNVWNRFYRPAWWWLMQKLFLERGRPVPRPMRNIERANVAMARDYITPDYDGRVDLFQTSSDPSGALQRRHAWEELAGEGVSVKSLVYDGIDHVNLMQEPYVHALATAVRETIDEILAAGGAPR